MVGVKGCGKREGEMGGKEMWCGGWWSEVWRGERKRRERGRVAAEAKVRSEERRVGKECRL